MQIVTVEQFKKFRPCWLETAEGREKFARIAALRNEWTALDVLNLPDVSAQDKLWSVLREDFIEAPILHEFACRCAEYALSFVTSLDPRSIAAIKAKRKWLRGEITGAELRAARDAAQDALHDAEMYVAMYAARSEAMYAARYAAMYVARAAAMHAAMYAARATACAAKRYATWDAAMEHEVEMLRELLKEGDEQ